MKSVRFLAAARRELHAEVLFSEARSGLGVKFTQAIEHALAIAVQFPLSGCPGPAGTRKVTVKGFPFSVVYLPEDAGVVVVTIAHHARRPGYWISRVGSGSQETPPS
jgi:plasmid stabilization system protein ParE